MLAGFYDRVYNGYAEALGSAAKRISTGAAEQAHLA